MKLHECLPVLLLLVRLSSAGYAAIVVVEYNRYEQGVHYTVSDVSHITILQPSDPDWGPYDFECYDDQALEHPERPIQSITAIADIGDVEIMVRGHNGRTYGASHVYVLNLDQTGVNSKLKAFTISGNLGQDGNTLVDEVDGPFEAASVVSNMVVKYVLSDMHVGTVAARATLLAINLRATLLVTGSGPHLGDITAGDFEHPAAIDVTGTLQGSLAVGGST